MDCGPAALKCLLDGFGLHASYGRLREACQTDVDGTSIDTLEDLANDVGLVAEQILVPLDHVLASAARLLPAIAVIRQPGGLLHFVVAWRRHGPIVQIMDPAAGRRWPSTAGFRDELYAHTMPLPASAWRHWAESDLFRDGLLARARTAGIARDALLTIVDEAANDASWQKFAALDATLRMVGALRQSHAFTREDAGRTLAAVWRRACDVADPTAVVPADFWTVRPGEADHVLVTGAVLVRVSGVRAREERERRMETLPPEVAAALTEPPSNPGRELLALLRADGVLAPTTIVAALLLAAAGVIVEAALFRSVIDLGQHLPLAGHRLAAIGALVGLTALLLALELPIASSAIGIGRRLETRLRIAFLRKIPRLADRYFHSRPSSDMAERGHAAHQIRELPILGTQLTRSVFELVLTTTAIAVLYRESAAIAVVSALAAIAIPALAQPWLRERDLRQRTHTGALTRFYLDAFLGLIPVRAHVAERSLAREQENLLVEWTRAGRTLLRTAVTTSGLQLAVGFGCAAWLLMARAGSGDESAGALLLAYWALAIPLLGQKIAQVAWQYPTQRNLTLRLLEPLGAIETEEGVDHAPLHRAAVEPGMRVELRDVTVRAAGHIILEDATLAITPGTHVAVVGPSGAGKSTLVGLLLGWHRPAGGVVLVDDSPLDGTGLDRVRQQTAWVDPAVQLWNRPLIDNLEYSRPRNRAVSVGERVADADLKSVIERLPGGLQAPLGEGGALVSGGEGQRVRFGRGLARPDARLVILDEPFRGLERDRRAALLRRARARWRQATLLCVTHDIAETEGFDRVLVLEHGRIVEDASPSRLAAQPESRYRALLDAESSIRLRLWADRAWRALRVDGGVVSAGRANSMSAAGEDDTPARERISI